MSENDKQTRWVFKGRDYSEATYCSISERLSKYINVYKENLHIVSMICPFLGWFGYMVCMCIYEAFSMLCKWIPGCLDAIQVFSSVPSLHKADSSDPSYSPFPIIHTDIDSIWNTTPGKTFSKRFLHLKKPLCSGESLVFPRRHPLSI